MADEVWVLIFGAAPLCGILTLALLELLPGRYDRVRTAPATGGTIYGGWWKADRLGRRVVCRTKCQVPDMGLYRANRKWRAWHHGF